MNVFSRNRFVRVPPDARAHWHILMSTPTDTYETDDEEWDRKRNRVREGKENHWKPSANFAWKLFSHKLVKCVWVKDIARRGDTTHSHAFHHSHSHSHSRSMHASYFSCWNWFPFIFIFFVTCKRIVALLNASSLHTCALVQCAVYK